MKVALLRGLALLRPQTWQTIWRAPAIDSSLRSWDGMRAFFANRMPLIAHSFYCIYPHPVVSFVHPFFRPFSTFWSDFSILSVWSTVPINVLTESDIKLRQTFKLEMSLDKETSICRIWFHFRGRIRVRQPLLLASWRANMKTNNKAELFSLAPALFSIFAKQYASLPTRSQMHLKRWRWLR